MKIKEDAMYAEWKATTKTHTGQIIVKDQEEEMSLGALKQKWTPGSQQRYQKGHMEINQDWQDKEKIKEKEKKDQVQRQEINPGDRKFTQKDLIHGLMEKKLKKKRKHAL